MRMLLICRSEEGEGAAAEVGYRPATGLDWHLYMRFGSLEDLVHGTISSIPSSFQVTTRVVQVRV